MSRSRCRTHRLAAAAGLAIGSAALAQPAPELSREVALKLDSGPLDLGRGALPGQEHVLAWADDVRVHGSQWMRVRLGHGTTLAGPDRRAGGSYIVITSRRDGARQYLDAVSLPEWSFTSAYLNGDDLLVELYAVPGSGLSRVVVEGVISGLPPPAGGATDTICGGTDTRIPDNDPRCARLNGGCTSWLITFNGSSNEFLTAGHCIANGGGGTVMFNTPPSTSTGALVASPPEFQFPIQPASTQSMGTSAGFDEDFARFNTNNNSNTGMSARVAQGRGAYLLAPAAPAGGTANTIVRGYGVVNDQVGIPAVPNQWNQIAKVANGPYAGKVGVHINYNTDTDGGNSGSPVTQIIGFLEEAIGIHTDGFCPGSPNAGTTIDAPNLQAALNSPQGTFLPFDGTVSKVLNTTFASDNGGIDGGSIFFDVVTGPRSIEVTHLNLNINRDGTTSNATATEDDDFFNFDVYVKPGTAAGFQTNPAAWTLVAQGAGMPRPEDSVTLGALKSTFTLNGSQAYGVAIVFTSGAAHAYTNGTGTNETYSNADLSLTGISAANTAFGTVLSPRVFNGGIGYHLNETTGQCLETLYATNNFGNNGGMVYFNVVTGTSPVTVTGISTNVSGAGGLNCNLTLYRKNGTHVGFETSPAAWTQVATASGTSAAADSPSSFPLSTFVTLNANTTYGFALQLNTSGAGDGHVYTNGTGLNQSYHDDNITINTGSASNTPFGSPFSPRVWNGALCYGRALSPCTTGLVRHEPPDPSLGGFNSNVGLQEEADSFAATQNWTVNGGTFWAAYASPDTAPALQNMVVRFFSNSGGLPGTLLATRTINNVPVEDTGLFMAGGFDSPIYQFDVSFTNVSLPIGTYWVSALSNEPANLWSWARINATAGAHAVRNGAGAWSLSAGDFAFTLCGNPVCYANCDNSTQNPFLNVADFTCFLQKFAASDPYANCDGSVTPPVLNVADFTCFLQKFAAGCSAP